MIDIGLVDDQTWAADHGRAGERALGARASARSGRVVEQEFVRHLVVIFAVGVVFVQIRVVIVVVVFAHLSVDLSVFRLLLLFIGKILVEAEKKLGVGVVGVHGVSLVLVLSVVIALAKVGR